jgi:hypothetical protein
MAKEDSMARRHEREIIVDEPRGTVVDERRERAAPRRHTETVVVDRDERLAHADAFGTDEEYVTRYADGWTLARGTMRMINGLIALFMVVIEGLLAFRLAFALGGANANNGFVDFIYDVTGPLVAPFEGIFRERVDGSSVFEPETVVAMAVWLLVALVVVALVNILMSAPSPTEREGVRRERHRHYSGSS